MITFNKEKIKAFVTHLCQEKYKDLDMDEVFNEIPLEHMGDDLLTIIAKYIETSAEKVQKRNSK